MTRKFQVPQDQFLSRSFLFLRAAANHAGPPAKRTGRHFLTWARNGIYHSLRAAKLLPGEAVLVPSYICKVVPEAVEGFGAQVVYYGITKDCRIDFGDLESKLERSPRALIAAHYFGFPQPAADLRTFCDRHRLYFIEDCAHVLRSEREGELLGTFGDASVFSLRKFFPLYDGAELILNGSQDGLEVDWAGESTLYTLKIAKDLADQIIGQSLGGVARVPFQLLMSLASRIFAALKSRPESRALAVEKTDAAFDIELVNSAMSRLSSVVYNHSDVSRIASARKSNYLFLQRELRSVPGIRFLSADLPEGVCPWVFPVFLDKEPDACGALREQGIPAVNWEGVRPASLPTDLFPDADFLYQNLIFLPVHQNLTENDLLLIAQAVKRVVKSPVSVSSATVYSGSAQCVAIEAGSEKILRQGTNQS